MLMAVFWKTGDWPDIQKIVNTHIKDGIPAVEEEVAK